MSFLDSLLNGIKLILNNGAPVTSRTALNFKTGFTVQDNAVTNATDVSATAALTQPLSVANVSSMRLQLPNTANSAFLLGYSSTGDGGEGEFVWNGADTRADDGGTVIQVTGQPTGRWNRIRAQGIANVVWFGAIGDGQRVTDGAVSLSPSDPTLLSSASGKFKSGDVGKLITVDGAGAAGATLATTIASYVSATQVHLTAAASTSVSGAVVEWGTNSRVAINAALSSIKATNFTPGLFSSSSTLYFPPGWYMVDQAIVLDGTCVGIQFSGASQGQGAPTIQPVASKLSLKGSDTALFKNTSQSNTWRGLWLSGGHVASRAVIDFEYFADHQSFYDCMFDGPAPQGYVHYYGQDNGALEIDNIKFWNCFLYSDFYNAAWLIQAYVYNNNGNAFQIDYYHGFWEGTVIHGMYFAAGSVNLHGTQVYGWTTDFLHIYGTCSFCELEDVYTEQTAGNFIAFEDNGNGLTSAATVVMRRCHLNAPTSIVWGHMQPLVLEDCEIGGNINSNLGLATPSEGYEFRPIVCRNLTFVYPNIGFTLSNGSTFGQHVIGDWININNGTGSFSVTDAAITSTQNLLNSPGGHFTPQFQGMLVSVPGAGAQLSGTVSVANGSPTINFTVAPSLFIGEVLEFASQAGTPYTIQALVAGTGGLRWTLSSNYTGTTNTTTTANVPLVSRIAKYIGSTQVQLHDTASNTVSAQTPAFTPAPIRASMPYTRARVFVGSGYDVDGYQLACGAYVVPPGQGVQTISADEHYISTLTSDRAFTLSNNGALTGMELWVHRVGAADSHKATITYSTSAPTTISLIAGQWAKFVNIPNSGWVLAASGASYSQGFTPPTQAGTLTLVNGLKTISTGITVTASSHVHFTMLAPVNAFSSTYNVGTQSYQALTANMVVGGPGVGTFVVAATKGDGNVNTTDGSTLGWVILQ